MKRNTGRKLLSILISLMMVLGLMPGMSLTAHAESNHFHEGITFTAWTSTNSLPSSSGNYYLTSDVTISSTWEVPTGTTNLCLNGHCIKRTGSGRVINIAASRTLNLYDCNATESFHKFSTNETTHLATLDEDYGSLIIQGGCITGGQLSTKSHPGVNNLGGAGIGVHGTLNMYGGTIIGNYINGDCAGVHVFSDQNANFNMYGGTIRNNYATGNAGGVQTNRIFTMSGGLITENKCDNAGGGMLVQWYSNAGFTMTGGEISGNYNVGIFFNYNGTQLTIGSDAVIENNLSKDGASKADIRVASSTGKISLTGVRSNTTPIYITGLTGVFTSSSNTTYNDVTKFASTDPAYMVGKTTNGQLTLVLPYSVTYDGNGATAGDVPTDDIKYVTGVNTTADVLSKGNLVKEGYKFAGWKIGNLTTVYANSTDNIPEAETSFTITGNTTLTAQWEPVPATTPIISAQPQDLTLTNGYTKGSLIVTAAAATDTTYNALAYQWYSNTTASNEGGTMITENGNTAVYTIPTGKTTGTTYYFCVVTATRSDNGQIATATSSVATVKVYESAANTPAATFTATGADTATLSGVTDGMKYSLDGGTTWTDITSSNTINLTGLSAGTIQVVKKGNGTTTADSNAQTITVTKAETLNLTVTQPETIGGKGSIAATTAHEYSSNNGTSWIDCAENQELEAGSYLVRVKASGTVLASENQAVTIKERIGKTVTFKVVNGSWNEGEGDAATADKTVTLTGYEGDTLKLATDQIPAVGNKPNDTYKTGSWDTVPSTETAITAAMTYTYTYMQNETAVVTKAPTAKELTYTGAAQTLVTEGEASGGEMQYTLGTETEAKQPYTTSIPTATNAGTYHVWYKVQGDSDHNDSPPACVTIVIREGGSEKNALGEAVFTGLAGSGIRGVDISRIRQQMTELAALDPSSPAPGQVMDTRVAMNVTAVALQNVPENEKNAVRSAASGIFLSLEGVPLQYDCMEITVEKTVIISRVDENGNKTQIQTLTSRLTRTEKVIDIPVSYDLTEEQIPVVARYHNGSARVFTRLDVRPDPSALVDGTFYVEGSGKNTIIHIYADRFSLYAILAYPGSEEEKKTGTLPELLESSADPSAFGAVAVPVRFFTFRKEWQGGSEGSIDFTLYRQDGTVFRHGFKKHAVNSREWKYEAWFSEPVACYVIEEPVPGYSTQYVNVGAYAHVTDRCCDGGTIINRKIPKTGDDASPVLWAVIALLGMAGILTMLHVSRRRISSR